MTWHCECGAFTDSDDTRALFHLPHCPLFHGKPATIVREPPTSPEAIELARVRKQLAMAVGWLEKLRDSQEMDRQDVEDALDEIAKVGK